MARAHRAPDGLGYTAVYVAPEPQLPLSARALSLSVLSQLLGHGWQRLATVTSGYSTYREELPRASRLPTARACCTATIARAWSRPCTCTVQARIRRWIATLHSLGVTLRLILQDLWSDAVIDLADRAALSLSASWRRGRVETARL